MKRILFALIVLVVGCSSDERTRASHPLAPQAVDPAAACIREADGWERYAIRVERAQYREAVANCAGDPACLAWALNEHEALVAETHLDAESWRYQCTHGIGNLP